MNFGFHATTLIIRTWSTPGKEGAEVPSGHVVIGAGHGGEGAAPEVIGAEDGDGGVLGDALHQVTPLARQLVGSLASLHTCGKQLQQMTFKANYLLLS